jgi:glycosyltransferase involved in cell wall biosynthesis
MEFSTKDHLGHERPLNIFANVGEVAIVFLHDCAGIIEKVLRLGGEAQKFVFVLTWSWWVDENKCLQLAKMLAELGKNSPNTALALRNNVIICMNSASEYSRYRAIDPKSRCVKVNNSSFLSTETFKINSLGIDKDAPAIMNAKSWIFKRHYLTEKLNNKIFISYREEADKNYPQYCDIRKFDPRHLYLDVSAEKVSGLNSEAGFGLALSEVEGACYASTEYLLCGLPVISTPSLGGRDEFYSTGNSIIAHPSANGLLHAEGLLRKKIASGDLSRDVIRKGALSKIFEFRSCLSDELSLATGAPASHFLKIINYETGRDNKMYNKRNFWIKDVASRN